MMNFVNPTTHSFNDLFDEAAAFDFAVSHNLLTVPSYFVVDGESTKVGPLMANHMKLNPYEAVQNAYFNHEQLVHSERYMMLPKASFQEMTFVDGHAYLISHFSQFNVSHLLVILAY